MYLYIMIGLPGSGKSHKARTLVPGHSIVSADHYWSSFNISFDHTKLPEAHRHCQAACRLLMRRRVRAIVVDNTNLTRSARETYLQMAKYFHYEAVFVLPDTDWAWDVDECAVRTIHNVPRDHIQSMKDRYEPPV